MTAIGTTPICQYCGRPIAGATVFGNGGEMYHLECTQPPRNSAYTEAYDAQRWYIEKLKTQNAKLREALAFYANPDNYMFIDDSNNTGYLCDFEGYPCCIAQQALEETK